jgi:hypothetical protein
MGNWAKFLDPNPDPDPGVSVKNFSPKVQPRLGSTTV